MKRGTISCNDAHKIFKETPIQFKSRTHLFTTGIALIRTRQKKIHNYLTFSKTTTCADNIENNKFLKEDLKYKFRQLIFEISSLKLI